jgi:hypothetical protein
MLKGFLLARGQPKKAVGFLGLHHGVWSPAGQGHEERYPLNLPTPSLCGFAAEHWQAGP